MCVLVHQKVGVRGTEPRQYDLKGQDEDSRAGGIISTPLVRHLALQWAVIYSPLTTIAKATNLVELSGRKENGREKRSKENSFYSLVRSPSSFLRYFISGVLMLDWFFDFGLFFESPGVSIFFPFCTLLEVLEIEVYHKAETLT